jgi:recombination protein RecR
MFTGALGKMIDELGRMPGIGPKSAQRLAFFLLRQEQSRVEQLARALLEAKDKITTCPQCFALSEGEGLCGICRNPGRDQKRICVVEEPSDVFAIERTRSYHGLYHVLMGTLSPLDSVGPEELKIKELLMRLREQPVEEVIIATNPSVEGEATALYLSKLIQPSHIHVTRLASGMPAGSQLEYADELTISHAFSGRRRL